jgi:hypothetical protein
MQIISNRTLSVKIYLHLHAKIFFAGESEVMFSRAACLVLYGKEVEEPERASGDADAQAIRFFTTVANS